MAGYIGSGASVVSSGAENKKVFDITTNTTSLTGLNYTVGKVHVYHNGVRLVDGTDYTATNSTSITLTVAAASGDQVVVVSYASFQLSEHYTKAETDTLIAGADSTPSIDDNGNATALTIDSSENVMVGTTNSNIGSSSTEEGIVLNSASTIAATRSGNVSAVFNRLTTDGDIISLRKNGSTVGTIGVIDSNNTYFHGASGHGGIAYGTNSIIPFKEGAYADSAISLGQSNSQFKNLYLSGGIQFDPSAKLGDYEEGNWTPADSSGAGLSLSINAATYIKIGKFVMVSFDISWPSTSTTNASAMSGLPFTVANTGAGSLSIGYDTMLTVGGANKWWIGAGSTSAFSFGRTNADMSGGRMIGSGVYIAN